MVGGETDFVKIFAVLLVFDEQSGDFYGRMRVSEASV
jgi:hypothetical protein